MEMQKALHLHLELEKKKPNVNHKYIVTEKKDGWWTAIDYDGNRWHPPKQSSLETAYSLSHTLPQWEALPRPPRPCRIIAEAKIPDIDFHTMNGIFNRRKEYAEGVEFHLHDLIFDVNEPALDRYSRLRGIDFNYHKGLFLLPIIDVTDDLGKVKGYAEGIWDQEGEGVVLKRVDSPYKPGKRDSSLMKIKLEKTFDLLCIDMYWTQGEKGNDNLNLMLKNLKGITVPVRVGKHSDIHHFTNVESPVGRVVQIKCMKQLLDGSYREPRFQHVRYDKKITEIN